METGSGEVLPVTSPRDVALAKKKRLSVGWILTGILLSLYLLLKGQGIWYGLQVRRLTHELIDLRPTLSAIALSEQIKTTGRAYAVALRQIGEMDLNSSILLQKLSEETPASVTLQRLELNADRGLIVYGTVAVGIREPEAALLLWVQRFHLQGHPLKIRKLVPDAAHPGLWIFELREAKSASD